MKFSDAMSRDLLPETGQAGERAGGPADGSIASTLDPRRRCTRSPAGARVGGRAAVKVGDNARRSPLITRPQRRQQQQQQRTRAGMPIC